MTDANYSTMEEENGGNSSLVSGSIFGTIECGQKLSSFEYDVAKSVTACTCLVLGTILVLFGYRWFRASMFLLGFIVATTVLYLVLFVTVDLHIAAHVVVAICSGIGLGLLCMLVPLVGIFLCGLLQGAILALLVFVIIEFFYHVTIMWIPIGVIGAAGIVTGILGLKFQKALIIGGTSCVGAALLSIGLDYFLQLHNTLHFLWDRVRAADHAAVCWPGWVLMGVWCFTISVAVLVQARLTARYSDHTEPLCSHRRGFQKVQLGTNESATKSPAGVKLTEREAEVSAHSNRYRQMYLARRSGGDVLSQQYMQNLAHKTNMRSLTSLNAPTDPDYDSEVVTIGTGTGLTMMTHIPDTADTPHGP